MNFKILAIDDDPGSLELVISALQQDGVEILGASDPQEGLALFQKEQPDLVLVDLMMPKMNGIEVLKRIVGISRVRLREPWPTKPERWKRRIEGRFFWTRSATCPTKSR
jgi:CheY-like chemotaxis protein